MSRHSLYVENGNELCESRNLRFDTKSVTGTKKYRVYGWGDVEDYYSVSSTYGIPVLGDAWGENLPYLKCVNIICQETSGSFVEITCEYSADGFFDTDYMQTSLDFGMSEMDCGPGWLWESSQLPVNQDIRFQIPTGTYTIRMKPQSFNPRSVVAALNVVNASVWHGFPAETLLFLGADSSNSYSVAGQAAGVDVTYKFSVKPFSHNYVYRKPVVKKYWDGTEMYYHNIAELQNVPPYNQAYTTNPSLVNTPVYDTANPAGRAGWDKPIITEYNPWAASGTGYMHPPGNFTALLSIPDLLSVPDLA